jgi:hypothetical protein
MTRDAPAWYVGNMVVVVPILAWLAALAALGVVIARTPKPVTRDVVVDRLLRYLFLFPVGLMGIWGGIGHVFLAEEAARAIGWQPSPFQYEVGVANFGIGAAGLYAAFSRFEARLATALMVGCFLIGAGVGHIRDIVNTGNLAPGNAGPILFTDFLTPIAIFVLLWLSRARPTG